MTRERATKILSLILATIQGGDVPVRIDEVWVFGSYARGALDPRDIDLIILHEGMPDALRIQFESEAAAKNLPSPRREYYPVMRHRSMITKRLRKPAEKVEILLGCTLEEVLSRYPVAKNGRLLRLWTHEDQDWQTALMSISPDPNATRAERHEFIPCKRANCSLQQMQRLTAWIDEGVMMAERIQPSEWPVPLSATGRDRLEHLVRTGKFGKASQRCAPLGMWWLEQQGSKWISAERAALDNRGQWPSLDPPTQRVSFGALLPARIAWFLAQRGTEAAAHVLHFTKSEPRELLGFRRGPAWARLGTLIQSRF